MEHSASSNWRAKPAATACAHTRVRADAGIHSRAAEASDVAATRVALAVVAASAEEASIGHKGGRVAVPAAEHRGLPRPRCAQWCRRWATQQGPLGEKARQGPVRSRAGGRARSVWASARAGARAPSAAAVIAPGPVASGCRAGSPAAAVGAATGKVARGAAMPKDAAAAVASTAPPGCARDL
jgi:hypothetical protein